MKITMFGAGYVGLITGVCLAEIGHLVKFVDINEHKIAALQKCNCPIYEPKLPELLKKNSDLGRVSFTTNIQETVAYGSVHFIAVGTPQQDDGSADLKYVIKAAESIGKYLTSDSIIINKSTVPVGTLASIQRLIKQLLQERDAKIKFAVVSNPEFLKQGEAIDDFFSAPRIVVGAQDENAITQVKELYQPLLDLGQKMIIMDIASAELTKYAANVFLANKISFINEMSAIASHVGADIEKIREGIGTDPRIGSAFLRAGCGFGGSCFPKDVRALISIADELNCKSHILNAIDRVNNEQKNLLFYGINKYFSSKLHNKTIALWGLAFKPNTDDMREAPSRVLLEALWREGCKTKCYDPAAMHKVKELYGENPYLVLCQTKEETLIGSDLLVIVTEWSEFKNPDFAQIKNQLNYPVIFDGRNLFDPQTMTELGIEYHCIGRGNKWIA
jgi:UDPglucose 6-dehydrogenase